MQLQCLFLCVQWIRSLEVICGYTRFVALQLIALSKHTAKVWHYTYRKGLALYLPLLHWTNLQIHGPQSCLTKILKQRPLSSNQRALLPPMNMASSGSMFTMILWGHDLTGPGESFVPINGCSNSGKDWIDYREQRLFLHKLRWEFILVWLGSIETGLHLRSLREACISRQTHAYGPSRQK